MERWKAERIDEIVSRHRGSSYGLAIRLQQQFGMSWREATTLAGYDDRPSSSAYSLKTELPPLPVLTPEEIKRHNEEILRKNDLVQKEVESRQRKKEELLSRHKERLKRSPSERISELMELAKTRKQLFAIRDNQWQGIGAVDEETTIIDDKNEGAHVGVLMLKAPHFSRLADTVTHTIITEWTWSDAADPSKWEEVVDSTTIRDYDDFASVRVGIYLPHLGSDPSYSSERDAERIGVQILQSNLRSATERLLNERTSWTYVPIDPWPRVYANLGSNNLCDTFRILGEGSVPADILSSLLVGVMRQSSLDIRSLTNPLPPLPTTDDQPWYKRLFGL